MTSRSPMIMDAFAHIAQGEVLVRDMEPEIEPEFPDVELDDDFDMEHEMRFEFDFDEPGDQGGLDEEIGRHPDFGFQIEPHVDFEIEMPPDFQIQIEPEEQIPFEEFEGDFGEEEEPVEEIEMEEFQEADNEEYGEEIEEQNEEPNSQDGSYEEMEMEMPARPQVPLRNKIGMGLFLISFFIVFFLVLGVVPALFVWLHLSAVACFPDICFVTWVYGILLVLYYGRALWHFFRCETSYLMYTYGIYWHLVFCVYLAEGLVSDNILPTIGFTVLGYAGFCLSYLTLVSLISTAKPYVLHIVR